MKNIPKLWVLYWLASPTESVWYAVWPTRKQALSDASRSMGEYKRVKAGTTLEPGEYKIESEDYVYFGA